MSTEDIDLGYDEIIKNLNALEKKVISVGVLSSAEDHPGNKKTTKNPRPFNMVQLASIHEFGLPSRKIPRRPFIRTSVDLYESELFDLKSKQIGSILDAKSTADMVVKKVGAWMVGKIKKVFIEGNFKPNARSTIARKKSSQPLIDTGRLRQSINYEVKG